MRSEHLSMCMRKSTILVLTWYGTNQPVQSQKQAIVLKFWIFKKKKRNCTICVAKTKAVISFTVTVKLVCAFIFAYANCWFSHAAAHLVNITKC